MTGALGQRPVPLLVQLEPAKYEINCNSGKVSRLWVDHAYNKVLYRPVSRASERSPTQLRGTFG